MRTFHLSRALRLARWLGPWSNPAGSPDCDVGVADLPVRHLEVSRGRGAGDGEGVVLLIPGLHFLGPDDSRFRRFAAVLAQTGCAVVAPFLDDFMALHLAPRLFEQAHAALVHACERARGSVSVMSISFGSIVALNLAARFPDRIRRMIVFGGYRHLDVAFRFALGGAIDGFPADVRDPLNGPAVLANLADELLAPGERAAFREATLAFCRRTWSRGPHPENKRDGRHLRVGAEIAATLDGRARELFRVACRLEGDPLEVAEAALPRARERIAFLDPGPLLGRIEAPVTCVHGRDDDVIPWSQSEHLARDLPRGEAVITGLYGHTGGAERPGVRTLVREVAAMGRLLSALAALTAPSSPR